ncbi:alpha/beta hydrolase [Texcoconibacillus texcoconensis]|uniref:Lysophospholipase n=1 Tax=Texcoconibacillus texcoconensis TaxID=1095777 RepID=A0A840QN71_9BACI|nr:alpha/beta hydrolase [Texcoconibacillus texcoconensis]MBB5172819.1 lysophospholipase [Texcoconibacillus texcoconensis]
MWIWKTSTEKPKGVFVLVHGAGEYHRRYNWVIERLNEQGFHVVMGDLPGQGTTKGKRGHIDSFDQYTAQISKWLDAARPFALPTFLFGHSMGGLITIHYLEAHHPDVDGIILSSPCLGLLNPPSLAKKAAGNVFNRIAPSVRFSSGLDAGSGTRDENMRKRDEADTLLVKKVSVRWYRELERAMKQAKERVTTFPDLPLLVLQAGDDRIVNKHDVNKWFDSLHLKDKWYKEWDGLYHEVLNEPEKEDVFRYMQTFVDLHTP